MNEVSLTYSVRGTETLECGTPFCLESCLHIINETIFLLVNFVFPFLPVETDPTVPPEDRPSLQTRSETSYSSSISESVLFPLRRAVSLLLHVFTLRSFFHSPLSSEGRSTLTLPVSSLTSLQPVWGFQRMKEKRRYFA